MAQGCFKFEQEPAQVQILAVDDLGVTRKHEVIIINISVIDQSLRYAFDFPIQVCLNLLLNIIQCLILKD